MITLKKQWQGSLNYITGVHVKQIRTLQKYNDFGGGGGGKSFMFEKT